MSSNHTFFTKLALLLAMIGALALAGCGGDDGVDQSVHDMALAAQAEAEQKAADEEAARMAAEEQAAADLAAAEEAAAAAALAAAVEAAAAAEMAAEEEAAAAAMAAEEEAAAALAAAEEAAAAEAAAAAAAAALAAEEAAAALAAAEAKAEADRMASEAAAAKELMDVQAAAAAAMTAAKTASDMAAMDADAAMTATANIATLQTGQKSMMMAMDAQDAADGAMAAYMAAKTASETAAAAMTVEAATVARVMADAEQANAEKYAMAADEKSMGAVKYAMTELMIDGTMKSVGGSSIDARMGMLTDAADDGSKIITGMLADADQPNREIGDIGGAMFVEAQPAATPAVAGVAYKQAIAEGNITIGKTLDTTDDMARLMLITDYRGSKTVRVFANGPTAAVTGVLAEVTEVTEGVMLEEGASAASVGMYYEAIHTDENGALEPGNDVLEFTDEVAVNAKGVEIFKLSGTADNADDPVYGRIVRTIATPGGTPTHYYRVVDITAAAAPDDDAPAGTTTQIGVTAALPAAMEYDHLHFGVWASLGGAKDDGSQMLADLGIGFVQNFSDSGITEKQGIGTATFEGDWVAAIQRAHGEGEGAIVLDEGRATLMANFGTDEFMGVLSGLATLEGSLSGNGFSGMKATVDANNTYSLTVGGTFSGMFEGGIYGADGEEAGGIFDFSSESDGAFRGAFGGHRDGN